MAKKTYRTFFLKGLQLLLTDEAGDRIEIKFRSGIQVDSTSRYTTSNEEVQRLLEEAEGFNRDYYIESVKDDGEPAAEAKAKEAKADAAKPVMTEVKGSERFKNLVEMKNRMAGLGIELEADADYNKAKAAAAAAGYDFKIKR